MGRLDWLSRYAEADEKKAGPRNWDSCWKIDSIDENGIVLGSRMTSPPYDRTKFYALKKGRIKVFPDALVTIVSSGSFSFQGVAFKGAAVYDEVEIVTDETENNNDEQS